VFFHQDLYLAAINKSPVSPSRNYIGIVGQGEDQSDKDAIMLYEEYEAWRTRQEVAKLRQG
jgi:hypothetical protein